MSAYVASITSRRSGTDQSRRRSAYPRTLTRPEVASASVRALQQIDSWGAEHAAAAVVAPVGVVARRGPSDHVFRWASVTKPATALAALVAVEEGVVDLDEPAGP